MKTKLLKRIPAAAVLCLIAALAITTAMTARAAEKKDAPKSPPPTYMPPPAPRSPADEEAIERAPSRPDVHSMPLPPRYSAPAVFSPPPALPAARRTQWNAAEWKDPNWTDPDIILTNFPPLHPSGMAEILPLSEIVRMLQRGFKNHFDVLLPHEHHFQTEPGMEPIDVESILIKLELRNVRASEVFNAMNLLFETENVPWRWQLVMNGERPTAVFRILPELLPAVLLPEAPKKERMVFFVGDLIGDEKSGGMTFDQIVKTVMEVCKLDFSTIKFHDQAQLFVVTAARDDIRFVQSTLSALKQKVDLEQKRKAPPTSGETKTKSEATKAP